MKNLWNKFKNWKYFKLIVILLGVLLVGWIIFILFIQGMLEFRKNEKIFLEGVQAYYDYNPLKLPAEGSFTEHKLSDMFLTSWVKSIFVPGKNQLCDGDSFVRVINENGNYRYVTYLKCGRYESKVDHSAPEIVLNGDDTIVLHLNDTYTDPGVKEVKDQEKIDVKNVDVDTSKVNTSKMGTYEVHYKVYDHNKNSATASRTVIVAETLSSHIQNTKGANYVFTGEATDNYVLFSGMLFRIVKVDSEGNLALITNQTIANVPYGNSDKEYPDSNIYKWLNNYFLSNIQEGSKRFIVDSKWCYDEMGSATISDSCESSVSAKVGLLSVSDFERSKADNRTYLVNQARYYLLNRQSTQDLWVTDLYTDNSLMNLTTKDIVGVRPVIYLSKDIFVTSGEGSLTEPYKLQDYSYGKENELLNTRLVGEYVVYSGYFFRVAGVDGDGNTKLVGTGLLQNSSNNRLVALGYKEEASKSPNADEDGNLYYYLNQDAVNYISESSIVAHEFEVPIYESGLDYDQFKTSKVTSKIGLPASFEMFSGLNLTTSDYQIYWLSDYNENGLVSILNGNNGLAFYLNRSSFPDNAVKPVIYLKNNLKIASGRGTATDPYYVR